MNSADLQLHEVLTTQLTPLISMSGKSTQDIFEFMLEHRKKNISFVLAIKILEYTNVADLTPHHLLSITIQY